MTDLERELTRHLHERAAAIEPHPDLDAVVSGLERPDLPHPEGRRTRVVLVAAAAVVFVASIAVAVTLRDDHPRLQSRPTTPANGVILVHNVVDGVGQFDPTGRLPTVPLPPTAQSSPRAPVFAPDGRHIAYTTGSHVSVADLDAATEWTVGTCNPRPDGCPIAWSHDGSTLAVGTGTTITLLDPNGPPSQTGRVIATTGGEVTDVNWTPDDKQLIYAVRSDGTAINTINRDGTGGTTLVAPDHGPPGFLQHVSPALSPDGSTLAWIDGHLRPDDNFDLVVVTMNLADRATTTHLALGVCFCNNSPGLTWSPDGTMLAITTPPFDTAAPPPTRQLAGHFELYLATTDGSHLTRTSVVGGGTPTWQPIP